MHAASRAEAHSTARLLATGRGECDPIKIEEYNNFSDPQTKYLVYRVWMRHLHYTHNLAGDPPPPVDKSSKKMSPSSVLVNMTKKNFLFAMGL